MEWRVIVRLLLDTQALLWWTVGSDRMSKKTRASIADYQNEILLSAASVWETGTKFRVGRLPQAEPFVHSVRDHLHTLGFSELTITVDHAQRAGMLAGSHKDPFDRMLIAQALTEGLQLVSNDRVFDSYHVHRIW